MLLPEQSVPWLSAKHNDGVSARMRTTAKSFGNTRAIDREGPQQMLSSLGEESACLDCPPNDEQHAIDPAISFLELQAPRNRLAGPRRRLSSHAKPPSGPTDESILRSTIAGNRERDLDCPSQGPVKAFAEIIEQCDMGRIPKRLTGWERFEAELEAHDRVESCQVPNRHVSNEPPLDATYGRRRQVGSPADRGQAQASIRARKAGSHGPRRRSNRFRAQFQRRDAGTPLPRHDNGERGLSRGYWIRRLQRAGVRPMAGSSRWGSTAMPRSRPVIQSRYHGAQVRAAGRSAPS